MTHKEYAEIMDKSNFLIDSANPYDMEIKKALEKQMPIKPKLVKDVAHCSRCSYLVGVEYNRFDECYCSKCGQKIDWSVWEDSQKEKKDEESN